MPPPAETLLDVLETAAAGPLVVFGSLPPGGRDLDVLVRDDELPVLERALAEAGAVQRGHTWALFANETAFAVDLVPVSAWELPPDEVEELWRTATPVPPYRSLSEPAPAQTILVLARTGVSEKRRSRLEAARASSGALEEARRRAPAWRADLGRLDARARRRPPVRAPRVVALSGLDGAGKSTQARALAAALEALGYDARIEWAPILQNRSIELLSRLARVLLRLARRGSAPEEGESLVAQAEPSSGKRRALAEAWTTFVALVNAASHRRASVAHRGSKTVVIHDRFVLDSTVRLRFLYGAGGGLGRQKRLLRLLSPRPAAAFWLDVPAELAYARKPEHWDVDDLTAQRALYEDEHERLGVRRLDGERPPPELAAEIAAEVWRSL